MSQLPTLPEYLCTKKVRAVKIKSIEARETSFVIVPDEYGIEPFEVSTQYMAKHSPAAGGYFVVYKDGYQSYSPAEAFEDGYERI